MKWMNKWIFGLMIAALAGCTTAPKSPENPYLGYMYYKSIQGDPGFKQDGVDAKLQQYAEQIAAEVFEQRSSRFGGVYNAKSLEKMQQFVDLLERPISIQKTQWSGAVGSSLGKKEQKAVAAYWSANQPFSIDGSKAFNEWDNALKNARRQLKVDRGIAAGIEAEILRLRADDQFRAALTKIKELRLYRSSLAEELTKEIKREGADHWIGIRMLELDQLEKTEVYDQMHEKKLMDVYHASCDDVGVFGHRDDFNGVFAGWQDLLSENWRKRIVEYGDQKQYWSAYTLAADRYEKYVNTKDYAKSYRDGLKLNLAKGYLAILDNAVRHYSDQASNACKLKNYDGKAFVYCCMAKEMYDFIIVAGWGGYAGEDAETWFQRLSDLEKKELIPALTDRVSRRLVIHDFDLDVQRLAKRFRESSREKYGFGNNVAWGLEVVADQAEAPGTDDYAVEWSSAEIKVKVTQKPPVQKPVFVKTGAISVIDNPDSFRKDKASDFYKAKQIKAQKVALYSVMFTELGLQLKCDMRVSCGHREKKEFLKLEETVHGVNEYNKHYGKGTNITASLLLPNVSEEMKYYAVDTADQAIPIDEVPKNVKFVLPEEEPITAGLVNTIIRDLDKELENIIGKYPLELLPDAVDKDSSKYLDSLGTLLFYVMHLSKTEADKRELAGKGFEWLHLRDQIADDMEQWCKEGGRWAYASMNDKAILKSLWEECVAAGNNLDQR